MKNDICKEPNEVYNNFFDSLNKVLNDENSAFADGLEAISKDIENGKINTPEELLPRMKNLISKAPGVFGKAADAYSLSKAMFSDEPVLNTAKEIAKIGGSAAGAVALGGLATLIVGSGGGLVATLIILGAAAVGSYKGSEYTEKLIDSILDNLCIDPNVPLITISNPATYEDSEKVVFDISLRKPLNYDLVLNLKTHNESATSSDYKGIDKNITIKAGETLYRQEIKIIDDNKVENDEKFRLTAKTVNVKDPNDVPYYAVGFATIKDNDSDKATINISNPTVFENEKKAVFEITLSKPLKKDLNLKVQTFDISAKSGSDYSDTTKSITIKAGETSYKLSVPIIDDETKEKNETFELAAFVFDEDIKKQYGLPFVAVGKATIVDNDDDEVGIIIDNKTIYEGDEKCFRNQIDVKISRELKDDEEITLSFPNENIVFTSSTPTIQKYNFIHYGDFKVSYPKTKQETIAPLSISTKGDIKAVLKKEGIVSIIDDDTPIYVSVEGDSVSEASEIIKGKVNISRNLRDGEYLKVYVGNEEVEFYYNSDPSKEFVASKWKDDEIKEEDSKFYINPHGISSNATVYVKGKGGKFTIYDDDKDPDDKDPENEASPIIIDMNKNSITSSAIDSLTHFDHNNDSLREKTAWIDSGDSFLALDKNNNGLIDNGAELFGNHTITDTSYPYIPSGRTNGFEALKLYDDNGDGIINMQDKVFDKLLLWNDINKDGLSQSDELSYLKDSNIAAISLDYKNINTIENGNTIKQSSKVFFKDGTTTIANDVWFLKFRLTS